MRYVGLDTHGPLGVVRLERPRTNSLDLDFLGEIAETLRLVEPRPDIRVVAITSRLEFGFSSGLDLGGLYVHENDELTADHVYAAVAKTYEINRMILASGKVYLAGLSGPVIGCAASIALSCDLRVSDERAWFWFPDPQYGGLLADGGIDLLCGLIGISRAKMLLLCNGRLDAKKADEWGLIYQVVPCGRLDETIMELGSRLTKYSPLTLDGTKRIINDHLQGSFRQDLLSRIVHSTEASCRLQSFIERKAPPEKSQDLGK